MLNTKNGTHMYNENKKKTENTWLNWGNKGEKIYHQPFFFTLGMQHS